MGLSMAYAGSARADLMEAISPLILDSSNTIELQAVASIAIGLIFVGTCDEDADGGFTCTCTDGFTGDICDEGG